MLTLGIAGVIKIGLISMTCGRAEYKLNQLLDGSNASAVLKKIKRKRRRKCP